MSPLEKNPAEQMDTPPLQEDMPPQMPQEQSSAEVCVPTSSLASPAEDEQMTSPEIGDLVQFQVEGKITRVEGENAYVSMQSVNGKPVSEKDAATSDTQGNESENEFAQLRSEAEQQQM